MKNEEKPTYYTGETFLSGEVNIVETGALLKETPRYNREDSDEDQI
jgi:hypothetical protein